MNRVILVKFIQRVLIFLSVLFLADKSLAQSVDASSADGVIEALKGVLDAKGEAVGANARILLLALFGVDLVLSFGRASLSGEELGPIVSRFIFRLLFVCFILFVIMYAAEIVHMITNASIRLASESSNDKLADPSISAVLGDGLERALALFKEAKSWSPVKIVFYPLAALLSLVVTAIIAGMLITVYAEMFIVALAGMITLGFGGLEVGKNSAVTYIKTLIGKGLKLLGLLIVYSLMTNLMVEVARAGSVFGLGIENVATILILQFITVIMMYAIPNSLESLAGGIGGNAAAAIAGAIVAKLSIPAAAATAGAAIGGAAGGVSGGVEGAISGSTPTDKLKGALSGSAKGAGGKAASYGMAGAAGKLKPAMAEDLMKLTKRGDK
jgi:P-type conjugative transfer protein TrbL